MTRAVHFISGLPRSGSTLLCAFLRQNPRFSASITSPAATLCLSLIPKMSAASEFAAFFDNDRRRHVLRAVFEAYHGNVSSDRVLFDTNRVWAGKAGLLADLYPNMRMICCVRSIGWVLDSIERMLQKHPLEVARFVNAKAGSTIYSRVEALMNSDNGLVGSAWSNLREAWFSNLADKILLVNYDQFVKSPTQAMERLYDALGETAFQHDFNNVVYDEPGFDADFGMPGLHRVRSKVEPDSRPPCIPPDIFDKYADSDFWRKNLRTGPVAPTVIC